MFRRFGGRPTGVDAHVAPEEVLPMTSGKSHAHTGGKRRTRTWFFHVLCVIVSFLVCLVKPVSLFCFVF